MIVKELVTKLGFDVDDKELGKLDDSVKTITAGFIGLVGTIAAASATLYGLVKSTADSVGQIKDLSESLGITTDRLQELMTFAGGAGISNEELGQSLGLLNRNLVAAKDGSEETINSFKKLGFSANELKNGTLTADSAIERISKNFDKLPEGPERSALAMQLFGRSGARLIPMLNDMRDGLTPTQQAIMELGFVSEEQVETTDKFARSLDFLNMAFRGIMKVVGINFIPVAQEVVNTVTEWIVLNKDLIKTNLLGFVKGLSSGLKVALGFALTLVNAFKGLVRAIGGVEFATKALLVVLTAVSGLAILHGIGSLATSLFGIIKVLGALRLQVLLTQAAALAMPILIGVAIVGLLLIFEDFFVFLQGGKSIIGDLFKEFPKFAQLFGRIFGPIINPIMEFFAKISEGNLTWIEGIKLVGQTILAFIYTPLRSVLALISTLSGALAGLAGNGIIGKALGFLSKAAGSGAEALAFGGSTTVGPKNSTFMPYAPGAKGDAGLGPLAPNATPAGRADYAVPGSFGPLAPQKAGGSPALPPAMSMAPVLPPAVTMGPQTAVKSAPSQSTTQSKQENNINQTLQFTFPPGTDTQRAAPAITKAVDDGLDGFLRNAARATK